MPKLLNPTIIKLPGHSQSILGKAEQANDLINHTDPGGQTFGKTTDMDSSKSQESFSRKVGVEETVPD